MASQWSTTMVDSRPSGPTITQKLRPRVAVVEDNRPLADSLCMLLDLVGYDTRAAYSGPDGVRLAEEWQPDAVITDIGLPGCDGFEVARTIRREAGGKRPLVVAVTAYGSDGVRKNARQAGADYFFVKPVDPAAILNVLGADSPPDETKPD
jgi:CheY-like chemotaxis protein